MIQTLSVLHVADNSGAKKVGCIKVFGGSKKNFAHIGDIIKVSVREAIPGGKAKKGSIYFALVVRTVQPLYRPDGSKLRFDRNCVVLLNDAHKPLGTRIFGPITRELRSEKFMKIISLAPEVI